MIAEGGYSDQANSPQPMGLCAYVLTSETWLPCPWDTDILSVLPQHEEEEERAVGRKYGQGRPMGRKKADVFSWLLAPSLV